MAIEVSCPACGKVLHAKDSAAGKQAKCPGCGGIISIPEAVFDAVDESDQGFGDNFDYVDDEHGGPAAAAGSQRRPCPQCGEMIVAGAAKCRFCGEIFDQQLRRQKSQNAVSDADKNLSGGEWVVCILCAGIGCICGIVYMIQGKPKGLKMIGVSLAAGILWNVISFVIQEL